MDYRGTIDGERTVRRAARAATSSSSSARAGSSPASRSSSRAQGGRRERTSRSPSPTTTAPSELKGREAEFEVTVNEVKRKELPELDDDFASDAGRLRHPRRAARGHRGQAARGRRAPASRPSSARPSSTPSSPTRRSRSPSAGRGARPRAVGPHDPLARPPGHHARELPADRGKAEDEIIEEARPDAEQALRREAVIAAVDRGRGHQAVRRRHPRRAAGLGRARGHDAGEAPRAPREGGPPRRAQGGPRPAPGGRSAGRERAGAHRRAGPRARQAVDPRQGISAGDRKADLDARFVTSLRGVRTCPHTADSGKGGW